MAICTRESLSPQNERIRITITGEDYLPAFEKSLKRFSKSANIAGFRKGMVPAGLIKKMHGQSLFAEEVAQAAEHELGSFLEKENIQLLGQPLSDGFFTPPDMNHPGDYQFNFEIGIKPDFDLYPLQEKLRLVRYHIVPTAGELEKEITRMREEKLEAVEFTSENQEIHVKLERCGPDGQLVADRSVQDAFDLEDFEASFRTLMTGKKKNEVLDFHPSTDLTPKALEKFPGDHLEEGGHWKMTIESIFETRQLPLDENFFKRIFPEKEISTPEAFQEEFKTAIQANYEHESAELLYQQIYETLVHQIPISLPESFLKKWLQQRSEKPLSEQEAENQYPSLDHQLRWNMISERLIRDNDIKVTAAEVEQQAADELYRNYPSLVGQEGLEQYLQKLLSNKTYLRSCHDKVVTRKLFEWLVSQGDLEEKEISITQFILESQKHPSHAHT